MSIPERSVSAAAPVRPRRPLLASCALAAIAIAAPYAPVRAQVTGFNGTPTVQNQVGGTVTASPTDIDMGGATKAIINWNANSNNFLTQNNAAGTPNSVLYHGTADYVVLNRITAPDASMPVQFNGTVNSEVNGSRGGSVWFYSPSGILVGSTGRFNVGSLLLTANNLSDDNDFLNGAPLTFVSGANSTAAIQISAGAQLNALGNNAYVALIAPRIVQAGSVTSRGSVTYAAAEQADVTISGTLFDIAFTTGTSVNGSTAGTAAIEHTGTTTLEAGYGSTVPQRTIVAAIPKNDAVTMLLSGGFNYSDLGASVVDNRIVISGGYNIDAGDIGGRANATGTAAVKISSSGGTTVQSDLIAQSTGSIDVTTTGNLTFLGSTYLNVSAGGVTGADATGGNVTINATSGVLRFNNGLTVFADGYGGENSTGAGGKGTGGTIALTAGASGNISVVGSTVLSASAIGGDGLTGGGAQGGSISLTTGGTTSGAYGAFSFDDLELDATARAGVVADAGGEVRGGTLIVSNPHGSFFVNGVAGFYANADADVGYGGGGGDAFGGSLSFASGGTGDQATSQIQGQTNIDLHASAGQGRNDFAGGAAGAGGDAQGGSATLTSGNGSTNFAGGIFINASGSGGDGGASIGEGVSGPAGAGGSGTGGTASLAMGATNYGGLSLGDVGFNASASGGYGGDGSIGGAGGNSTGGTATLSIDRVGSVSANSISLNANSSGGSGGSGNGAAQGSGGNATGGTASLAVLGADGYGALNVNNNVQIAATGQGGYSLGQAGNGNGGTASLTSVDSPGVFVGGSVTLDATGYGGYAYASGSSGGNGHGGNVSLTVQGDTENGYGDFYASGNLSLKADGFGGEGAIAGGDGTGGGIAITIDSLLDLYAGGEGGGLLVSATGQAGVDSGQNPAGPPGNGQGGTIDFALGANGSINLLTDISLQASGSGRDLELTTRRGGNGTGGTINAIFSGAVTRGDGESVPNLLLAAGGVGAQGGDDASTNRNGGNAQGGAIDLTIDSDAIAFATVELYADAGGGDGGSSNGAGAGGNGGNATAGRVDVSIAGNLVSIDSLNIYANAQAGYGGEYNTSFGPGGADGGNSGSATGGTVNVSLSSSTLQLPGLFVDATAFGGYAGYGSFVFDTNNPTATYNGGNGAPAQGGDVHVAITGSGTTTIGNFYAQTYAYGGEAGSGSYYDAGYGNFAFGNGGNGGSGTAGTASLSIGDGFITGVPRVNLSYLRLDAQAAGGEGGGGLNTGTAAAGQGGTAELRIDSAQVDIGNLYLYATGEGGDAGYHYTTSSPMTPGLSGAGGAGLGGTATITLAGDSFDSEIPLLEVDSIQFSAGGEGGYSDGGIGGIGKGGTASFLASGGRTYIHNNLQFDASGEGGDGSTGGKGTGGTASFVVAGADYFTPDVTVDGYLDLNVDGRGGSGYLAGDGEGGSTANGGGITVRVANGQLAVGADCFDEECGYGGFTGSASGFGGSSSGGYDNVAFDYGAGIGGTINVAVEDTGSLILPSSIQLAADGSGTPSFSCCYYGGGDGTGGDVTVSLLGSVETFNDDRVQLQISAVGAGGLGGQDLGGAGHNGGNGTGGTATVELGDVGQVPSIAINVVGYGGSAYSGEGGGCFNGCYSGDATLFAGRGGDGIGGTATISAIGAYAFADTIQIDARGIGGEGGNGISDFTTPRAANGGAGGNGIGGTVRFTASDGGTLELGSLNVISDGVGGSGGYGADAGYGTLAPQAGNGGKGGDGVGGSAEIATSDGSIFFDTGLSFASSGRGGNGGNGGNNDNIAFVPDTANPPTYPFVPAENGYGHYGGQFLAGNGGDGGKGTGGAISIDIVGGSVSGATFSESPDALPSLDIVTSGYGGEGGYAGYAQSPDAPFPIYGNYGDGRGGSIAISVADGETPGSAIFGDTSLRTEGFGGNNYAGSVSLTDTAVETEDGYGNLSGTMSFRNLDVTISGYQDPSDTSGNPLFSLVSEFGPIRVTGDALFSNGSSSEDGDPFASHIAGPVSFLGYDGGGLAVGGDLRVFADTVYVEQPDGLQDSATLFGNNVYLHANNVSGSTGIIGAATDVGIDSYFVGISRIFAGDDVLVHSDYFYAYSGVTTDGSNESSTFVDSALDLDSGYGSNIVVSGNQDYGAIQFGSLSSADDTRLTSGIIYMGSSAIDAGGDAIINGAVSVFAPSTVTAAGQASFNGAIDAYDPPIDTAALTVETGGGAFFSDAIGATHALDSFSVIGAATLGGGSVTTTGDQSYDGLLTLTQDTILTGASGSFGGVEGDGNSLALDFSGTTAIDGSFANIADLSTGAGGTTTLSGTITTSGSQSFGDAVLLLGDTTLVSSGGAAIAFDSTVDGAQALTVNTSGTTSFGDTVGGTDPLASLTTDAGGTTTIGSSVTTTGDQSYGDPLSLGGNIVLTGATGSFSGVTGNGNDLALNFTGTTALSGAFAGIRDLSTGAGGITTLAGSISTSGTQSYGDAVVLADSTTLTGTGATFFNGLSGAGNDLTLNLSGTTFLSGDFTGIDDLTSGGGGTTVVSGSVTTTGNQTYNDDVFVDGFAALTSTGPAGDISFASTVDGFGDLSVAAGGDISFAGTVGGDSSIGSLTLDAGGNVSLIDAFVSGSILAEAGGTFTARTLTTVIGGEGGGPVFQDALRPGIREQGTIVAGGNDITVAAGGAITIGEAHSAGGIFLASTGGDVLVSDDLTADGPVDASGRSVELNAFNDLTVRTITATAGSAALNSGGLLALTGAVNGGQINLVSRDIAIGQGVQVGTATGTQQIAITANSTTPLVLIGGTQAGDGYTLDNAEFGRLSAQNISIASAFGGEGGVTRIAGLTVRGSSGATATGAAPNVLGTLQISSPGDIDVTGPIAFQNSSAQNALRLNAGDRLFVDIGGGGITMTDANNGLVGTLELRGSSVVVATAAAANDLQNANTIAARNTRLGQNDGAVNANGVIRAGSIRLAASDRIHVQNTGGSATDDRAGLFAGTGGITLVDTSANGQPVEVIINGRQQNGATTVTGFALIDLLNLEAGYGSFAASAGSTVNGCPFDGSGCGFAPPPFVAPAVITSVVSDVVDEIVNGEDAETRPPDIVFNDLIRIERTILAPVIDEPVTGSGNDDYYAGTFLLPGDDDDDDEQGSDVDQAVTGTGNDALVNQQQPGSAATPPPVNDQQVTGTGNETLQQTPQN